MLARLLALFVAAACLLSRPAFAAMMRHHDLASLALDSEAIVRARRLGPLAGDDRVARHEILAVYAGPLAVGDTLHVAYAAYVDRDIERTDEVILFIRPRSERRRAAPPDPGRWPVASGVRLVDGGRVFRFVQKNNPGPYVPVPQGRDPYDVMHDPRGGSEAISLAEFEEELARAIARADMVRPLLADLGSPAGRRRALAWIGPPPGALDDRPVMLEDTDDFYEDRVVKAILEALARTGDIALLLDGVARRRGGIDLFMLRHGFKAPALFPVAEDRRQPGPRRAAATTLIAEDLVALDDPATLEGLARLLVDPDARVRRAAAQVVANRDLKHPALRAAIVEQFPRETDPWTAIMLAQGAGGDVLRTLKPTGGWPIVAVDRRGHGLIVRWAKCSDGRPASVALLVARDGAPAQRVELVRTSLSLGLLSCAAAYGLPLDPPPLDPRIERTAEIRLARDEGPRTFTIALPRLDPVPLEDQPSEPPPLEPPPPATSPPATPPPATPPPATSPATPPPATPPPAGCTCNDRRGADGAALLVVLLLARRRRLSRRP